MDQDNNSEDDLVGPSEDASEDESLPSRPPGLSDSEEVELLWQVRAQRRQSSPELPETVTRLTAPDGSLLYLVGTAHFSDSSKKDVATTIRAVQPDVVVVELCQYRVSMLRMDEKTLLKEAKDINLDKVQQAIKQNGVMSGLMQILLLKVSAHITEQLGMAPGGEFREAFKQAGRVPFCKFHLGDRPIPVTFKRAIAALSLWQKARLAWGLCFLSDPISKEDVEKCKQKDLLEQTMLEMIGEFPALHQTIVAERDIYLTHTLRQAARCVEAPPNAQKVPAVVVGVVGMGHVPGIERNWEKDLNIQEIMSVAPPSRFGWMLRTVLKAGVIGVLGYACYRAGGGMGRALLSLPAVQSLLDNLRPLPPAAA
uniref:traB domain-containing protein n=1 Tax=Oncorhynchus gorbuscha TaxID=8017 RepID=UPI001EAEE9C3|nr:traB domain-containing protein [Oncorhynchus gorbuscha]XP_046166254.1 traB domain-containing protein [Oncorhynchus gorbuscha]XP_046166264.1 traB domain-containing protein [Oncorhynchus gorbuscha]XP_046166273.1 traB domain-containing protein [Oncorhynchus gorbuscha]